VTRYGLKAPNELTLCASKQTYFIFGKESTGIPKNILSENKNCTVRIPTSDNVRSLNLANCVAIIGYEYTKQNEYQGLCKGEPHKPLF
jgi:tRNA (cytidine/uridine-2'-O-)-methyltransferase